MSLAVEREKQETKFFLLSDTTVYCPDSLQIPMNKKPKYLEMVEGK